MEEPSLDAPVLISPENGASDTDIDIELVWRPLAGAKTFQVQLREENGDYGDENSINVSGITENMYELEDLNYGMSYSWRVRGFAGDLVSPFSLEYSFSTMEEQVSTYNLNVQVEGNGTVTSSDSNINCGGDCSEEYEEGTQVTLTAEAADGWVFSGWSGDVPNNCDSEDCSITIDNDKTVTANFVEEDPFETFVFEKLRVCIEHGTNESDIFWLFEVAEYVGVELEITLIVTRPNGSKVEITLSSYSDAELLFHLDISVTGIYDWVVDSVNIDGEEIPFDGLTSGTVNVTGSEENAGQCTIE